MKKLQYIIQINAPAQVVYDKMLGLSDKRTYEAWTAAFNPTSSYEGDWSEGSKIYFVGEHEGKKGGMVSIIEQHKPTQFVSIKHLGILDGEEEITNGAEIEQWAGAHENYTFTEQNGITTVTVDLDSAEAFASHFDESFPKALAILKKNIESEN